MRERNEGENRSGGNEVCLHVPGEYWKIGRTLANWKQPHRRAERTAKPVKREETAFSPRPSPPVEEGENPVGRQSNSQLGDGDVFAQVDVLDGI